MVLRTLSIPLKVLLSCFLLTVGIGYVFAVVYLYLIEVEPHAKQGIGLVQVVITKYYGQRGTTRLEAALEGSMKDNLSASQRQQVVDWIRAGAKEADFGGIQPIVLTQCAPCHSQESGMPIPPLSSFDQVAAYAQIDMGQSIKALARVSHIHLFGMSFIFMFTGVIFGLSELRIGWRVVWLAMPFAAIWGDIGAWWVTRIEPVFAYIVIVSGMLMGLSLAVQIGVSLYEMWLKKESQS